MYETTLHHIVVCDQLIRPFQFPAQHPSVLTQHPVCTFLFVPDTLELSLPAPGSTILHKLPDLHIKNVCDIEKKECETDKHVKVYDVVDIERSHLSSLHLSCMI